MMNDIPSYSTGEPIHEGDCVRYDGNEGEIESVVAEHSPQWDSYWKDLGAGVMVKCATYGRVYVPFDDDHLELVRSTTNTD